MASGSQHHLEYGGSEVSTEFPGRLRYRTIDRIPVIEISHTFDEETARAIRYQLVASVGPERPFYHRHRYVVLDVRMVSGWKPGGGEFVLALQKRMREIQGDLYLVATQPIPVDSVVERYTSIEEAAAAAKEDRAQRRRRMLSQV